MGTITTRKRKDGSSGHTAQIRIKQDGRVVHTESQTFERLAAAKLWLKTREAELAELSDLGKPFKDPTISKVIAQYVQESTRAIGKTKAQVLRAISESDFGQLKCSQANSQAVVQFAKSLKVQPQTVGNYLAHLGTVFRVARPAWGYPLDTQAFNDARVVLSKLGAVSKSNSRERRPSIEELEQVLNFFVEQKSRNKATIPMVDLVLFAMFSSRRQEEITRLSWTDLDIEHAEIIVRDMKHPGEKIGNDVRVSLPAPALAVILRQEKLEGCDEIFPYNCKSVSAAFTRACAMLGIDDLHFHDLRHECVSWLFERGMTIPQAATVSGHRSWSSLKRYAQIRKAGDKYEGWAWLPR